jgi:hypothetical protein
VRDLALEFAADGLHEWLVREIRRELIEEGAYWMPVGRGSRTAEATRGLDGSTPESRAQIEATRRAIFAEKVGRGEEPAAGFRPARILTSPDYRFRENRR